MQVRKIDTPNGVVAARESAGEGPAIVLIHGNSASSRAFAKQLEGPLGARFRLVALDLPGHGESADAADPALYEIATQAQTLKAAIEALGLTQARIAGWSLGGHFTLELAPQLPDAKGFLIFGTPPLGFPPTMDKAFLPNPATQPMFALEMSRDQAEAYVGSFFRPGLTDIPAFFVEDALRADGRARAAVAASIRPGGYADELVVVRELSAPIAILQGAEEQIVNPDYFTLVEAPTLWRGAVQILPGAGHAPQWETSDVFDALIGAFVEETA